MPSAQSLVIFLLPESAWVSESSFGGKVPTDQEYLLWTLVCPRNELFFLVKTLEDLELICKTAGLTLTQSFPNIGLNQKFLVGVLNTYLWAPSPVSNGVCLGRSLRICIPPSSEWC